MLCKQGIINSNEQEQIEKALEQILDEISKDPENFAANNLHHEDIHMAIEARLTELIGETGKKLHTARSRNDQVTTDLRLWLKNKSNFIHQLLSKLIEVLTNNSKRDIDVIMPAYTHLQQAQAISLGHYWLAYVEKFKRDILRLEDCISRLDVNPLGSGALAGTSHNIDRELTTKQLGFSETSKNSLDGVSDRDYVCEYEFVLSMIMLHLSSISEEMIIWASQEFGFITIPDEIATGSSMMPQKKNPDIPELVRAKSGRVIGILNGMLITIKSLPLAYNKDLQEDKEQLFIAHDTVLDCLTIMHEFLDRIKINSNKMYESVINSYCAATDIADYLAKKNIAFRDAYKITGELTRYALEQKKYFHQLSIEEYQKFSSIFEKDIFEIIKPESMVDARNSYGGTSRKQVRAQIDIIKL
jgi:argininosuccinate lyase